MELSIIIPTYKGERSILMSVESAVQMQYHSKEIIVIDDNGEGSNSQIETEKLLKDYIESGKIKYIIHKKNANGSVARNTGFKESTGDFIIFLDDDDYLFPKKASKQIAQLKKTSGCGFSVSEGYYVHTDGRGVIKHIKKNDEHLYNYLVDKNYYNTSALVIRREFIHIIKGFDESFERHQDWEFCSRLMSVTKPCYIREPLFIKYAENRNVSMDLNKRSQQLDYFIKKVEPKLDYCLSKKQIKRVKEYKYGQLFRFYTINMKAVEGYRLLKRKGYGIRVVAKSIPILMRFFVQHITINRRKVTNSKKEMFELLGIKGA